MENQKRKLNEFAPFGTCCKDLEDAMLTPPNTFFLVSQEILYMSVGYANTEKGTAWFDQAIIYCPFCGVKLQDKKDISKKVNK